MVHGEILLFYNDDGKVKLIHWSCLRPTKAHGKSASWEPFLRCVEYECVCEDVA